MRRAAMLGILLLLGGCVYYNGMYNTKRLAGSARRAEREGRPFEAKDLWGQVITRAESLAVRHPGSKYVDEALVFKGIALARLGQCPAAMGPLSGAALVDVGQEMGEEAALALGRCQLELGDPGSAGLAFAPVLESRDPRRREEARFQSARALRLTGRPEEALAALDQVDDPRAAEERLLALAASDRRVEALAVADSILARADSGQAWDSVLAGVGRSNPPLASMLVDQLGSHPSTPPALHARRLLEDASRLEAVDSARATERLRQVSRAGRGTDGGDQADLRLLRLALRRAATPDDLAPLADTLQRIADGRSSVAQEARLLLATTAGVRTAADSGGPGLPQGDLRLFLAAETARDTLMAPALAASLFREVVESWPESPYAPKALLAGGLLDHDWGAQARPLLEERYAASPYVAFIRGEEPLGYRALEDSLQSFAYALAAAARQRPAPAGRQGDHRAAPDDGARRGGQRPAPRRGLEP